MRYEQKFDVSEKQRHSHSFEHLYKTNNWLRMHGRPMRRKPFKRERFRYVDELYLLLKNR